MNGVAAVSISTAFGASLMSSISPPNPGRPVEDDANRKDVPSWFWPDRRVPPLYRRGEWAFRRDLPELLRKHEGKYVLYNGDRRVAIDRSQRKLLDLCTKEGLIWYEYVVRRIDPAEGLHEPIWEGDDPAEENARFQEARRASLLDGSMPPLIWHGVDAYLRDLRELLKNHKGWWTVYSGDRRVGITRTSRQAFELAAKEGLRDDEFLVRIIDPSDLDDVPWPVYSDL